MCRRAGFQPASADRASSLVGVEAAIRLSLASVAPTARLVGVFLFALRSLRIAGAGETRCPTLSRSMPAQHQPVIHAFGLVVFQRWQVGLRG